jgi:hypothetical protein
VESDSVTGQYLMVLPDGAEYALYVSRAMYLFQSLHFNYLQSEDIKPVIQDVSLLPMEKEASVILNNLFFDVDQYELKQQSLTELNEIIKFLEMNESVKIEISGHTDNSGSESHNQQLSLKRAGSVGEYLKKHGINPSVSGFPTILYFHPKKHNAPEYYKGDRSYEDLKKWILTKKGKGKSKSDTPTPLLILTDADKNKNKNTNNNHNDMGNKSKGYAFSQSGGGSTKKRRRIKRNSHKRRKTSVRRKSRRHRGHSRR